MNSNIRGDCNIIANSSPPIVDRHDNPAIPSVSFSTSGHNDKPEHIDAPKISIPTHLTEGSYKDSFGAQHSIEMIIKGKFRFLPVLHQT